MFAECFPDLEIRVRTARDVAVEAQHAGLRPQLLDHCLEPLRPHPHPTDVATAAVVTHRWHRARVAAVVADQALDLGVLYEGDRATEALHGLAAVTAQNERRHAAAVEVQDALLLVLEGAAHRLDQTLRERLAIPGGSLIAHVNQLHVRILAAYALRQLREGHLAARRIVIRHDARRRRAGDQSRSGYR